MIIRTGVRALCVAAVAASVGMRASGQTGEPAQVLAPVRANQALTMNAMLGFVNGEPVFVDTLLRPLDEQLRKLNQKSRDLSSFKESAKTMIEAELQAYVSNILIISSAKAALTDEDKQKLELLMNKIRHDLLAKYGGSQALADQALKTQGSSVEKEINDQRRHITVQLYIQKMIKPKIVVTRPMVLDEYERTQKDWQLQPELELFTITLPVSRWLPHELGENGKVGPVKKDFTQADVTAAKATAMQVAGEVIKKLKAGASFAQLAEDYQSIDGLANKGGRTPNVKRGSLTSEPEEKYIFSLPANTLGQPFFIDDPDPLRMRVAVIKIGEKKEARTITFGEAQDDIRKKLELEQYKKLSDAYMKSLYEGAAIERVDRMVETAVDAAVARYATQ